MPLKSLQQIAATKFASTYLAPNLEFLYATPEESQRKLIDFFVNNPPEICLEAILAISKPILRAQLFVFLQDNANAIKDEIIEQRRKARSSYNDRAQETDTQTIHNDINAWRIALSQSLGISNELALDSPMHIDAFNEKMKHSFSDTNFTPRITNSVYYNPLSAFFASRKHDARDMGMGRSLAVLGLFSTLQQSYNSLGDEESKLAAIRALADSTAFAYTAQNDHLEILQWIYGKLDPTAKLAALAGNDYHVFASAAQLSHLETLQWIYSELNPAGQQTALTVRKYLAFRIAVEYGQLKTVKWIYEKLDVPNQLAALETHDYKVFDLATKGSHSETMKWIYAQLNEAAKPKVLAVGNYAVFQKTAEDGDFDTVQWIYKELEKTNSQAEALGANSCCAFRHAAARGHLETAQWIYGKLGETKRQAALAAKNYDAFWGAIADGHLEAAQWLYVEIDTASRPEALKALEVDCYHALRNAATNGRLDTLKWIYNELVAIGAQQSVLNVLGGGIVLYNVFRNTIESKHLETAQWIYGELHKPGQKAALATLEPTEKALFLSTISQNNNIPNESPNLNLYSGSFIGSSSSSSSANVDNNVTSTIAGTLPYLERERILNIDNDKNFANAVDYLNEQVAKMRREHQFQLPVKPVLDMVKLLNPEIKFQDNMMDIIKNRFELAFKRINTESTLYLIDDACEIYHDVGFGDKLINDFCPHADGHHRLAWLMMNYFLASNNYNAFYFQKGEYEKVNPIKNDRKGFNESALENLLKARCKSEDEDSDVPSLLAHAWNNKKNQDKDEDDNSHQSSFGFSKLNLK